MRAPARPTSRSPRASGGGKITRHPSLPRLVQALSVVKGPPIFVTIRWGNDRRKWRVYLKRLRKLDEGIGYLVVRGGHANPGALHVLLWPSNGLQPIDAVRASPWKRRGDIRATRVWNPRGIAYYLARHVRDGGHWWYSRNLTPRKQRRAWVLLGKEQRWRSWPSSYRWAWYLAFLREGWGVVKRLRKEVEGRDWYVLYPGNTIPGRPETKRKAPGPVRGP